MSVTEDYEVEVVGPVEGADPAEVLDLYRRCKALTLAAGATLLLNREDPSLLEDALALADEASASAARSDRERAQLAGLRDAALAIAGLVRDGEGGAEQALIQARAAHRELRSELGSMIAPQYAPCGAHAHAGEVHGA